VDRGYARLLKAWRSRVPRTPSVLEPVAPELEAEAVEALVESAVEVVVASSAVEVVGLLAPAVPQYSFGALSSIRRPSSDCPAHLCESR
jgi:hypothetical protein